MAFWLFWAGYWLHLWRKPPIQITVTSACPTVVSHCGSRSRRSKGKAAVEDSGQSWSPVLDAPFLEERFSVLLQAAPEMLKGGKGQGSASHQQLAQSREAKSLSMDICRVVSRLRVRTSCLGLPVKWTERSCLRMWFICEAVGAWVRAEEMPLLQCRGLTPTQGSEWTHGLVKSWVSCSFSATGSVHGAHDQLKCLL